MKRALALLAFALLAFATSALAQNVHMETARRVLANTPLIDGHNDLPWAIRRSELAPHDVEATGHDLRGTTPFHTDIERIMGGR